MSLKARLTSLINTNQYAGEVNLLLAVVESAIQTKDKEYFNNNAFQYHMDLLKLKPGATSKLKDLALEEIKESEVKHA